jgi:hypothetical protein
MVMAPVGGVSYVSPEKEEVMLTKEGVLVHRKEGTQKQIERMGATWSLDQMKDMIKKKGNNEHQKQAIKKK